MPPAEDPKGTLSEKRSVYFSYNCYLSFERINGVFPDNIYIGCARLAGWKWFINNLGQPNVKPSRTDFVYGSVYLLSERDEKNINIGQYIKKTIMNVDFTGPKGKCSLPASVYVDEKNVNIGELAQEYIDTLNKGIMDAFTSSHDYYVDKYLRPHVPEPSSVPK